METNYFVDIWNTELASDALTGVTDVDVVDATEFANNDTILIGTESYVISSISGNTITLSSATTADYSTGDAVMFDDSTRDGLSPSTAKRNTIFIDGADVNNDSIVWIKRSANLELAANTTGGSYITMIAWPITSDDYGYNDRPTEGISAGWDSAIDEFFLNLKTFHIAHNATTDSQVRYANMRIESDAVDQVPMFYKKGGNIYFDNCAVVNRRTHQAYGPFVRMQSSGTNNVWITKSTYSDGGGGASVVGVHHTDDHNFARVLHIIDSNVLTSSNLIYTHCTNDYIYQNRNEVIIENSSIVSQYTLISHGGYRSYINSYNSLTIINSTVRAVHLLKNTSADVYYGMSPLEIDISDSDIETTNTMFYFYHRNLGGHDSNGYKQWRFRDSRLKCNGNLVYFYRVDQKYIRQYGAISIKRCSIDTSGNTVIHMQNHSNWNSLVFIGNDIISMGRVLYTTANPDASSDIDIRDAIISSNLIYGGSKYNVNLSNVVVDGYITESNVYYESVRANNVTCNGFLGHGTYKVENSKLQATTATDVIPSAMSAVLRGCSVDTMSGKIGNSNAGQLSFIDCILSGDFMYKGESFRSIFNSNVNNIIIPYFNSDMRTTKEISSIFRISGSDGTLKLSTLYGDIHSMLSTNEINSELTSGASSAVVYFATAIPLDKLNKKLYCGFRYLDLDGNTHIEKATIEPDLSSSWDGIQDGINSYRAYADLVNIASPIGTDKKVVLELLYSIDEDDTEDTMYIDMNLKSE